MYRLNRLRLQWHNTNEDINRTVPLIKAGCDTSLSHHITTTLIGGTVEFAPLKCLEIEKQQVQRNTVVRWCWPVRIRQRVQNNRGRSIVSRRFSSTFFRRPHLHESKGHCAMIKRIRKRWITLSSFNDREHYCTQRCFSVLLYYTSLCQAFLLASICRDTLSPWSRKYMYMYCTLEDTKIVIKLWMFIHLWEIARMQKYQK